MAGCFCYFVHVFVDPKFILVGLFELAVIAHGADCVER